MSEKEEEQEQEALFEKAKRTVKAKDNNR